jgi:AcrR family transcriptional regulator
MRSAAKFDGHDDGRLVRGNRTREQLLAAALEKFGERGFAATTLRDIAERAGVTPPSIYNHFDSKENILHASLMWGLLRFREAVIEPDDGSRPPLNRLEGLVRRHVGYQIRHAGRVVHSDRLLIAVASGELLDQPRYADVHLLLESYRRLVDDLVEMAVGLDDSRPPIRAYTAMILNTCDRAPNWHGRSMLLDADHVADEVWMLVSGMLGLGVPPTAQVKATDQVTG